MPKTNYLSAVGAIKQAILKSRITAASLVNKELPVLYFFIGKYVAANTRNKNWGTGTIEKISNHLQQELNGLPVLYLSHYIIQNKSDYYRLLKSITEENN